MLNWGVKSFQGLRLSLSLYSSQFEKKNKEILNSASNSAGRNDVACSH